MSEDTEKLLREAGESYPGTLVHGLCQSLASFIAEIDSDSTTVSAYLEQRLGPVLRLAHLRSHAEFMQACADQRKLSPVASEGGELTCARLEASR